MKWTESGIRLSASDLANHLGCRHLTCLDLSAARGEREPPLHTDLALEVLQKRGFEHEKAFVDHLRAQGLTVITLADLGRAEDEFAATCAAMRDGPDVIVQATLLGEGWMGRADILRRGEAPSPGLGAYSYEVLDTKLARETRGRTILQLCLYSDLLAQFQGRPPERMYVVPPGRGFEPEVYRVADYMAYFRLVRRRLVESVANGFWHGGKTYPVPCEQCAICRWWQQCDNQRRADDHLSLVAGIGRGQIAELEGRGIPTLEALATLTLPLTPKPKRGAAESYERLHHQARVQLAGRRQNAPVHELLPLAEGLGLFRLPEPTSHDLYLDLEGARFVGEGGLECLFGWVSLDASGAPAYHDLWAMTAAEEKAAFERFIDEAMRRWSQDDGFHIYHYAAYEPAAIKRLMGRHATREDEVDRLLRGERFVDLYAITRQTLRAGVESYSLKELERFFGYTREVDLRDATQNLRAIELALEFAAPDTIAPEHRAAVRGYNRDDCLATLHLRRWLEGLRADLARSGHAIPRPEPQSGAPSEVLDETLSRTRELSGRLLDDLPIEQKERSDHEQARWLLAHLLEFHRREDKAAWWEYFRLVELGDEDLLEEPVAIGGLRFASRVETTRRGGVVDRYTFPAQETRLYPGEKVLSREAGTSPIAEIVAVNPVAHTVDLKKSARWADVHPRAVFAHELVRTEVLREALFTMGKWVADHEMDGEGDYRAGRDLLLRERPRLQSGSVEEVIQSTPDPLDAARRLALALDGGVLPVQGPPGSGKTYTGARMICQAVAAGRKVGITASSHKVIRNLLDEVVRAAAEQDLRLRCVQKVTDPSDTPSEVIVETTDNAKAFALLQAGEVQVAGGTSWLWARDEARNAVDLLFVDEAGQISLANALAVSGAARSLVLLGDPQQLEQPQRGSHPDGTAVSALEHLLGEHATLPADRGLFLETTWRLHPALCRFTSELFYENRLHPRSGLEHQAVLGREPWAGAGLWHLSVEHQGNRNDAPEEVAAVQVLVRELTQGTTQWVDKDGQAYPLTLDDVLVVAPYNAQVAALLEALPPGARVGTVDRFQGQEAPLVIYSMVSSSPDDAPRGMDFLYSLSRLNVATSRARCACVLVASPRLFEPECRTPKQMRLANAFCRYLELARDSGQVHPGLANS